MEQDKGQFKVPDSESQPPVDNFSPPTEKSGSAGSFKVPQEETPKPPQTPLDNGEVEDVFEKPIPPTPPKDTRGEPITSAADKPREAAPASGGQKLDIPPEKKGHGCLWVVIITLIIFLSLAGAIFVNEYGVLNLGLEKYYGAVHLEKLWGGLPKESKMALANSALKMKDKSFNLEGSDKITLTVETKEASPSPTATPTSESTVLGLETPTAKDTISKIITEGLDIQSEIKINGKIQSKNEIEVSLSTEIDSQEAVITDLLGIDTLIDLTVIYDKSDVYLKNVALKRILSLDEDWLKIINNSETPEASSLKTADLISGGERSGSEKINGTNCYVYEVKINSSSFADLANNYANLGWLGRDASFTTAKFYLGKRDHYIHKAEINLTHNPGNVVLKSKIILNFKNIGSDIQITVPDSDQTAEKNWSDVKNIFISGATPTPTSISTPLNTPEERDAKRKADLKKIQDALLAYKVQNGNYPSTLGAVEKTRDTTSNLKTALVPDFLESLPLDPENDKYYYGYKSDNGAACELTSILEVRTDPDGESVGSYWIYKLVGN